MQYFRNLLLTVNFFAEHCGDALGMESGTIPDEHITASSFFDVSVNAINARYVKI